MFICIAWFYTSTCTFKYKKIDCNWLYLFIMEAVVPFGHHYTNVIICYVMSFYSIIIYLIVICLFSSLQVRWDDIDAARHNRVSPWEIEPSGSASASSNLMAAGLKRTRIGLTSTKLEFPVPSEWLESFLKFHSLMSHLTSSSCNNIDHFLLWQMGLEHQTLGNHWGSERSCKVKKFLVLIILPLTVLMLGVPGYMS